MRPADADRTRTDTTPPEDEDPSERSSTLAAPLVLGLLALGGLLIAHLLPRSAKKELAKRARARGIRSLFRTGE